MKDKIKILILVPVLDIDDTAQMCLESFHATKAKAPEPFDVEYLIVCETEESYFAVLKMGLSVFYAPVLEYDKAFGWKKNAAVHYAMLNYQFDYLMECDGNGMIAPELFNLYRKQFNDKKPYFGTNRIVFQQVNTGRTLDYSLMNGGVWVTGSCVSRSLIEAMGYRLWDDDRRNGVEVNKQNRIFERTGERVGIIYSEKPLIIDYKTESSLGNFDRFAWHPKESKEVTGLKRDELLEPFTTLTIKKQAHGKSNNRTAIEGT